MSPAAVVAALVKLAADAAAGRVPSELELARTLLGLGLELVPVEELRVHLDDLARARIDAAVDAIVDAKFPRTT